MERICDSKSCALCMACANVCPKGAIYVGIDEYGYESICIDRESCIDCGLCKEVCGRRNRVKRNEPHAGYAAQAKNTQALMKSASGGAFQMLAEYVLETNGVCYGCTSTMDPNGFSAKHIRVDSIEELPLILNSKYVPSRIGTTYRMAEKDLLEDRFVLFSGTPCQIQGLKAYLNREFDNLLTVDVICHGVASTKIFNDYIDVEEKKYGIKIVDYLFRDKSISWGTNFCYRYYKEADPKKRIKTKHLPREGSSYKMYYLRGDILRENCFSCSLSNTSRVSDFTLGDYWEIEMEHPEFVTKCDPPIVLRQGISCILANTEKAKKFVSALNKKMVMHEVSIDSIVSHNGNLKQASRRGKDRDCLLQLYKNNGYEQIEKEYESSVGKKMIVYKLKNTLKSCLPDRVRIIIYNSPKLKKFIFHS